MKDEETDWKQQTSKEYYQSLFRNKILQVKEGPSPEFNFKDVDMPQAKEDEELIRVSSTGLNRADLLQCQGKYPPPEGVTNVLGLEAAGFKARKFGTFDLKTKWMALLPGGGFQQYIAVNKQLLMNVPQSVEIEDAGGIPETFMASYLHLKQLALIKKNDNVLIYAGASGVGSASIQLTKLLGGNPYVLVSNKEKLEFCQDVGACYGLAYKKHSEEEIIENFKKETKNKKFDIILDCVGPSNFNISTQLASQDCRWILYGVLSGAKVNEVNLASLLSKRIQLISTTLRNRSDEFKYQLTKSFKEEVLPYFDDRHKENNVQLKVYMDHRVMINWNDKAIMKIKLAHEYMQNNDNCGKIVYVFPHV